MDYFVRGMLGLRSENVEYTMGGTYVPNFLRILGPRSLFDLFCLGGGKCIMHLAPLRCVWDSRADLLLDNLPPDLPTKTPPLSLIFL